MELKEVNHSTKFFLKDNNTFFEIDSLKMVEILKNKKRYNGINYSIDGFLLENENNKIVVGGILEEYVKNKKNYLRLSKVEDVLKGGFDYYMSCPIEEELKPKNAKKVLKTEPKPERTYTGSVEGLHIETLNYLDEVTCVNLMKNETCLESRWYLGYDLHLTTGPAITQYFENGKIKREAWYNNGSLHRIDDLPAVTVYGIKTGTADTIFKQREEWWTKGELNRYNSMNEPEDKPAIIEYYENGRFKSKMWHEENKFHRENGIEAVITYLDNDQNSIESKSWFFHGYRCGENPHDSPKGNATFVSYYENGQKRREEWNDEFCDESNKGSIMPYCIEWNEQGVITKIELKKEK